MAVAGAVAGAGANADAGAPSASPSRMRWTRTGVLAAFAMLLGYLETFIPIPIPGVKLGLANIPVLVALSAGDVGGAACISAIKVLASGLLFGSPVMMAYSAAGTALALLAMSPLSRLATMRLEMTSVVGAIAHEAGQLAVAALLLGTPLVWYSTPVLLVAGCITGLLCGIVARRAAEAMGGSSREAGEARSPRSGPEPHAGTASWSEIVPARSDARLHIGARPALVALAVFVIAALHASGPVALACCAAVAAAACIAGRVKARTLLKAARPLAAILAITFVAQVVSLQGGTEVLAIGPVSITSEALAATGTMVVRLASITAASIAFMHLVRIDDLIDAIAWLLSPLRRLGFRTDGFLLALNVALQTVPALAGTARKRFGGMSARMLSPAFWKAELPRLVADLYALNR